MNNSRYTEGLKKLSEVDGDAGHQVIQSLKDIAPDLGKYIIEFGFGDIYSREGLSLKERELITLSSLASQGCCEPQLRVHIKAALNVKCSPKEILETMMQLSLYVGFPKVLNAVFVVKSVLDELDIKIEY